VKTIISKIKALFSKEVKQTEQIKPAELNGARLLAWWRTIPSDSVITDMFTDIQGKCCCVIGHYNRCLSDNPKDYSVDNTSDGRNQRPDRLRGWSIEAMRKLQNISVSVAEVNNGQIPPYQQKTPWLRVEAFFKDVVEYEKKHGPIVPSN